MLNRKSSALLSCIALLSVSASVFAAPKVAQKGKDTTKANPTSFEPFSLDTLDADHISPKYTGVPIGLAITAIEKLTRLTKGEFETTADFEVRQKAAIDSSFLGNLKLTSILPFIVDVQKRSYDAPLYYSYNADRAEVTLTDGASKKKYNGIGGAVHFSVFNQPSLYTFTLSKNLDSKETYSASNAYGATVTVEKLGATEYAVATDSAESLTVANLPMVSSVAESELPYLKALVLVKLKEPYLIYDFYYAKPTRDNPVELTVRTKSLVGEVLGVIYFSGRTGMIIARSPGLAPAKNNVVGTH
jgi:hypothetical protein